VVEDYLYNKHLIKIKMEMKLFTLLLASIAIIITLSVFVGLNINNQDAFIENDSDNDGIPDTEDDLPFDPSEQNDTDGDGVGDNSDKFPKDPAASVDSDNDGYPDYWNPGKSQSDSTSIPPLELDEFPNDPDIHKDSDGDGIPSDSDINDNVDLSITITLEGFEVTSRVDFFRWAQVYFEIKIDGEKVDTVYNNDKNWIVRLNKKQDINYALSYDIPDETNEQYMNIEVIMYDHNLILEDDIIDISDSSGKTLMTNFDKIENTISNNGLSVGSQGKLWYNITTSEEAEIPEEVYDRTYSWRFNNKYWEFSQKVPVDIYESYVNSIVNRMPQGVGNFAMVNFVTSDDKVVQNVADKLNSFAEEENYNQVDTANFILKFVQKNVLYASDNITKNEVEYWRYPVETLVDKKGDCEDSSVLFASIMDSLGYDTALLFYVLEDDVGHLAVGIHLEGDHGGYAEDKDGKRYYYCETTNSVNILGEIPPHINEEPEKIIPI